MEYMFILYIFLGLLGLFIVATVLRTIFTRPEKTIKSDYVHRKIDRQKVTKELSEAVKIETISLQSTDEDGSKFLVYQSYLEKTYPKIMKIAEKININKYSVIYKIEGSDATLLPLAILAHQDVVPAPEEGWEVPPFSGEIKDGYIYGRGSQDMKSQMVSAMHGLELLLKEGFMPKRSIYFCFGHDEEMRGTEGASNIVKYLKENNIRFEAVVDEGGTILDGKILGINNKVALIGTCEKGYADIELEVKKIGGHASTPKKRTAVGILGEAVMKVEKHQPKAVWTKTTKELFKALAPYMNFAFKYFLVNRDIYSPLLKFVFSVISPFTKCLVKTTIVPTQVCGAKAPNVLPSKATANVNCRLIDGTTLEDVQRFVQKVVGKDVKLTMAPGAVNPSAVSDINTYAYNTIKTTITEVFDGYIVAPYPFIAASDAKYYHTLSNCVYRFTPFEKSEEDASRIHAENERIAIDELVVGTEFFLRLYQNICG